VAEHGAHAQAVAITVGKLCTLSAGRGPSGQPVGQSCVLRFLKLWLTLSRGANADIFSIKMVPLGL